MRKFWEKLKTDYKQKLILVSIVVHSLDSVNMNIAIALQNWVNQL